MAWLGAAQNDLVRGLSEVYTEPPLKYVFFISPNDTLKYQLQTG